MAERHLFTSESVTEGHPDKIADQISDSVLDALIAQDKQSRVACETLVTTGLAIVAGEISSRGYVEIPELVRRVIAEIGYLLFLNWDFAGAATGIDIPIRQDSWLTFQFTRSGRWLRADR